MTRQHNLCYTLNMTTHIAVDVGGTQLRAALYRSDSIQPEKANRISTRDEKALPLQRLVAVIDSVWPSNEDVAAIGVAAPGPLNPFKGIIYKTPNISGWENLPLVDRLQKEFGVPVLLGNDANLAALGEWQFGAGRGHHHLIYMTVSTGIGTGIIDDDRLLLGVRGLAAELGHVTVLPGGPVCGCGLKGHLEAVASGTGIASWAKEQLAAGVPSKLNRLSNVTARHVAETARMGDQLAMDAMNRAGEFIGHALADFLHILNPSIIIIGGGVSLSWDLLEGPLRSSLQRNVMSPQYLEDLIITTADLGDDAGLIGALVLARSHQQESVSA